LTVYRVHRWGRFLEKAFQAELKVYWVTGRTLTARAVFHCGDVLECGLSERWSGDKVAYYVGVDRVPGDDCEGMRVGMIRELRERGFIKVGAPSG